MALKVKAVERLVRFNKNDAGKYLYVMQACWDAAGEVIKTVLIRHVRFFFCDITFFLAKSLAKKHQRQYFCNRFEEGLDTRR